MSFVVFRIAKLKTWGQIGAAESHNLRTRPTANAGPGGFIEVVPLATSAPDAVRKVIGDQTIRKNGVLAVEIIASASPEYFRPNCPEVPGFYEPERLEAWREKMEPWIKERFPHAVSVILHLDETTPHYQIIDVPLDEKGKLNCRGKYGGKENLVAWQDAAAATVASLGIQRGIAGSTATHDKISSFYAVVNAPTPPLPAVRTQAPAPLPPRTIAEQLPMTDAKAERDALEEKNKQQRAQRDAEKIAQTKAMVQAWPQIAAKANLVDLAGKQRRERDADAARASAMKTDADKLRALPIDDVLRQVYGAELEKGSKDDHASRKFKLPDGREIAVSAGKTGGPDVWIEQGGTGQRGAINLVMHLDSLDYKSAVRLLAEHFDSTSLTREHARVLVARAEKEITKIKEEPVAAPAPDPSQWPRVKKWLREVRGMPTKLIDALHSKGLIYADSRGNCTFKRVNGGAFQRGTTTTPFHRAIGGASCGPFIIPGDEKSVVLVEAPIDAMAVKSMNPNSKIIASGGDLLPPAKLAPWIQPGAIVQAAHDNDKHGDQVAKAASAAFKGTRLRPDEKDWAQTVKNSPWRVDRAWNDESTVPTPPNALRPSKPAAPVVDRPEPVNNPEPTNQDQPAPRRRTPGPR